MRAFLAVAVAIGSVALIGPSQPGYALDVGVSVGGGGLSAGGGASVGGVSAGGDVNVGGGGVSAGGNVNTGGGGVSAGGNVNAGGGVSAGGNVSAGGRGISAGGDVSAAGGGTSTGGADEGRVSAGSDVSTPGGVAGEAPGRIAPTSTGRQLAFALPIMLRPSCAHTPEKCGGRGSVRTSIAANGRAVGRSKALPDAVTACRNGIVKDAAQFGALRVDAYSAGRVRQSSTGGQIASLTVRITYPGEVKEAPVDCYLDAGGMVVAVRAT